MDVSFTQAANAYANRMRASEGADEAASSGDGTGKPSFTESLTDAIGNAIDTQHAAENVSLQALSGKVELADLVTAVANAELTLNTVVTVRDRVIAAYQDIMRMPI